jgi:hypothetical protein
MSYGILKFKLPEEQEEFKLAQEGGGWKGVCWDMFNAIRSKVKYGNLSPEVCEAYEELRAALSDALTERGLEL